MYAVVSTSDLDGTHVDEFSTLKEAESFIIDVTAEGYTCTLCKMLRTVSAQTPESHNSGIYAPYTMQPQQHRHVM